MLYYNIGKPVFLQNYMTQVECLTPEQIEAFLKQAVQEGLNGTLSCLREGKWNIFDIVIVDISDSFLKLKLSSDAKKVEIKIDQPVGICIHQEHFKYIFESVVIEPSTSELSDIFIEGPEKIEKMQRRAYERQRVPSDLNVRAMFWHRGYYRNSDQTPDEHYWQGKLENLSAGGAMIRVGQDHRDFFSIGQYVGLQFTPMSYQKPLLLEGQVRHLKTPPSQDSLLVGVEFLGLEASPEGRDVLHRLLDVIEAYEAQNHTDSHRDTTA